MLIGLKCNFIFCSKILKKSFLFFIIFLNFAYLDSSINNNSQSIDDILSLNYNNKANNYIEFEADNSNINLTLISSLFPYNIFQKNNYILNEDIIDDHIKNIYNSNSYSSVKIKYKKNNKDKYVVKIFAKKNNIISDIKFRGNKKIKDEILLENLDISKGDYFRSDLISQHIRKIHLIYEQLGRLNISVTVKIKKQNNNYTAILFDIDESQQSVIRKINFTGNKIFSDKDLKNIIQSKEKKFYKLFNNTSFTISKLNSDIDKLNDFYKNQGYLDFKLLSSSGFVPQDNKKISINFILSEGKRYNFSNIEIINEFQSISKKDIKKLILIKEGKKYNQDLIDKSIKRIKDFLYNSKIYFNNVDYDLVKDANNKVKIIFNVSKSDKIYINDIIVKGNYYTSYNVIRNNILLKEGNYYKEEDVRLSKSKLLNLGFFEYVNINEEQISKNKINIIIELKEIKTGQVNLGFGYSTTDSFLGNITISENNTGGTGNSLSASFEQSVFRRNVSVSYKVNNYNDNNLDLFFRVNSNETKSINNVLYDQQSLSSSIGVGYDYNKFIEHSIISSFRNDQIRNINGSYLNSIDNFEGNYKFTTLTNIVSYKDIDNIFDPKNGQILSVSQDYAGIIYSNVKYLKNNINLSYYNELAKNLVLKLSFDAGVIDSLNNNVNSNYNFYIGGYNLKGFEHGGIGPRVKDNNVNFYYPIGGQKYYIGNAEIKYPIPFLYEYIKIYTGLFYNLGNLFDLDRRYRDNPNVIYEDSFTRSAYGLSILWTSPIGIIRLDFSKIARKREYDKGENFRINFGTRF